MKKEIREMLSNWNLDREEAEQRLEFVIQLMEIQIQDCRENHPQATRSLYEMEVGLNQIKNLSELFESDPNVEYLMNALDLTEEQVQELVEESSLEAKDLVDYHKGDKLQAFENEQEAFNWVHEDLDREELLDMLYKQQSNYNEENEYFIGGQTIYINK